MIQKNVRVQDSNLDCQTSTVKPQLYYILDHSNLNSVIFSTIKILTALVTTYTALGHGFAPYILELVVQTGAGGQIEPSIHSFALYSYAVERY